MNRDLSLTTPEGGWPVQYEGGGAMQGQDHAPALDLPTLVRILLEWRWLIISSGNPVPQLLPIFYLPTRDVLIGVIVIVALGIAAGALPAIQAMRLSIAVALRRNG